MIFSGLQVIISIIVLIATSMHQNVQGSILKTDTVPSKCVVHIDGKEILKEIGDVWVTNDTCIKHSCEVDDHGTPYEKLAPEFCFLDCKNEYEIRTIPGKCCGECVRTKCKHEGKLYKIGETWRSSDSCMLLECSQRNGEAIISSYKKSCPQIPDNCPKEDLYEEDCCVFCKNKNSKKTKNTIKGSDFEIGSDYKNHPCKRECIDGAAPKKCYYKFHVEWYETLSKACYDCPNNLTDCYRPHCIVGDGARRSVLVVNRMMPGPAIEVCQNDTIIVDVENNLLGDTTTIHWHGLQQRQAPYMDGVPHISQCPIPAHTTFRYTFKADHPGTHFWHSHTGMQRGDGCFGSLIIRQSHSKDPQSIHYDYDLSEHVMVIQDWSHVSGISMFASHHHSIGGNKPSNLLINGYGRFHNSQKQNDQKIEIKTIEINHIEETTTESINENKNQEITTMSGIQDITTMSEVQDTGYIQNATDSNMKLKDVKENNQTRVKRSIQNPMKFPLESFVMKKGFSYRFRLINAEFLNCPVILSVDNHTLLVINSDGFDLEPIEVNSLVTYAGERFDFILKADQEVDNYWIRLKGLMDCDERFMSVFQVAKLHYEGAPNEEPTSIPTYDYEADGLQLNPLNKGPGYSDSLVIPELNALRQDDDWNSQEKADYKFYIYYDFYPINNARYNVPNLYGFNQVKDVREKLYTPQLNHISLEIPAAPLLPARDQYDDSQFCNASSLAAKGIDCRKEYCECSHVLQVPYGSIVELVFIDEGNVYDANHPFHLHGNAFRVIGMDRIRHNVTVEEVKKMDEEGLLPRKLRKAPLKDSVTVPDGGYTIIRFKADNPGYWLLHCHIEFHAEIGMALVFKVGDNSQMAPVPENFPTCSNYEPKAKISKSFLSAMNGKNGAISRLNLSLMLFISLIVLHFIIKL